MIYRFFFIDFPSPLPNKNDDLLSLKQFLTQKTSKQVKE